MKTGKKHTLLLIFSIVLIPLFIFTSGGATGSASPVLDLLIIHTNDFHGNLEPYIDARLAPPPEKVGGAAFIASKIRELRKEHHGDTLLLDAGDIAMGTAISNEFLGKPVVEYMNLLSFDAMAVGNHEFDWKLEGIKKMSREAKFPFLAANIVDENTGETPYYLKPYKIFDLHGTRVAVIGLTTPTTPTITNPDCTRGLKFLDPAETVRTYTRLLHKEGITIVGVLSHLGLDDDRKLAGEVPGIPFIIGGHSHTVLKGPVNVGGTVIVQTGAYGMYLGTLYLTIDRDTGKVLSYNRQDELIPILDRDIAADPEVEAILAPYRIQIDQEMNEVLGCSKEVISKHAEPGRGDTPIGNLITDILRQEDGTEIFFYNSGGLRAPIAEGTVTKGDIYRVIPFNDYMVSMELSGRQILDILRSGVQGDRVIQVSGLSFSLDVKNKGISRVCAGGAPLDPEKLYRVGTIDYLLFGGDSQTTFRKGRDIHRRNELVRDIVYNGVRERGTIAVPPGVRITLVDDSQ